MAPARPRILLAVLLLSAVVSAQPVARPSATAPASAPGSAPAAAGRVGVFRTTFAEQSPLSPIESQNRRHRIGIQPNQRYVLADESFEVVVPDDYDPKERYGVFVWVSPGARGSVRREWHPILKRHRLIGVGANESGNQRGVGVRFGLALDAVHNLKKQYHVNETRVYVAGMSGGGKVASMLGLIYPEVFQGGAMPICGVSYFRDVPLPTDPTKRWPRAFDRPPAAMLDRARRARFVLITGSTDMNHDSIHEIANIVMPKDGFKHVKYVEVPGMGHEIPDVDVMERAFEKLDPLN